MCGIAGFLGRGSDFFKHAPIIAKAMADALSHRGPDDAGVWCDPAAGVALSHRRLSIIDLSPAGHQPMVSACGRYVVVFNGEIYNHLELRAELETRGAVATWRGHSDTETLLEYVADRGVRRTLEACTGMFAFALWDRNSRKLVLARDRMGEKPLYYGRQGDWFLFGSELKSLAAHPHFRGQPSPEALTLLLRYNYIPSPHSIFSGIYKLSPGCFLTLEPGKEESVEQYWSLAQVARSAADCPFAGTEREAVDRLETELSRAIQSQRLSDVPLGALLSGGIDSSTIVALLQRQSSRPVKTFTVGFSERDHDEAAYAAAVARHLGTDHSEVVLSAGDALALIPLLPRVYDEPFADSSQLPTQLVMRLARQHVTVALSGDGADELFGGYNRYWMLPAVWKRAGWLPRSLRGAIGASLLYFTPSQWDMLLRTVGALVKTAQPGDRVHKLAHRLRSIRDINDLFLSTVSAWEDPKGAVVATREPPSTMADKGSWPKLSDPIARMMALDGMTYLPDDILAKVDRAAMSVSLETRAPYLDHHVVEFAWRLPMSLKVRGRTGKWALRQVLHRHVPQSLVDRPKMGFSLPLDAWLRGPLRDWAESLLDPSLLRQQGYFREGAVRRVWTGHLAGGSYSSRLWSILMFQAWLAEFTAGQQVISQVLSRQTSTTLELSGIPAG